MAHLNSFLKTILSAVLLLSGMTGWGQIISQYVETNSGTTPKGIEIWNNTGADIDFSANNLEIYQGTNGSSCGAKSNTNSGTLKAGEVWIIGTSDLTTYANNNGADVSGITTYGFTFNGDDALQVLLGGTIIDVFGTCGSVPGSAWSGSGVSTANQNISILAGITSGTTTGWTDPSTRFETTSTNPAGSGGMAGFGDAPSVPSTITIADNGTQIAAGTVNQGAVDHILSQTQAAVTVANATLNSFEFTTGGTYDPADITNFRLRYSTDATLDGADATLATETTIPASGGTVSFTGLSQVINDGSTGYFFVTADIDAAATAGNTVSAGAPTYTFAAGTPSGTPTPGGAQTIQAVTPSITLDDNGTQIAAGDVDQNTDNHVLSSFEIAVTTANATLSEVEVTTSGTYTASDVNDLRLWYSTDNSFNAGSDTELDVLASPGIAGVKTIDGFTQVINSGSTGYFFVTVDVPCAATTARTIAVSAIANTDLTFTSTVTRSGSATAAGDQTVTETTPDVVTGFTATAGNTQLDLAWTGACFDEVLVIARTVADAFSPSGDGTAYTADAAYGSGSEPETDHFVVYKGSGTSVTVTALTNSTLYNFDAYTRKGTTWSGPVNASATPVAAPAQTDLIITAVYDGPLSEGTPKGIELYAVNAINDLSYFAVGSANNGGGTDGHELVLAAVSLAAGDYYYVASETTGFTDFFGFAPDEIDNAMGVNGDDAIELFYDATNAFNGSEIVSDVFGDINTDGTGEAWDYLDGWAYRQNRTGPDGSSWTIGNWSFSGTYALDGETSNAGATNPVPIGSYTPNGATTIADGNWADLATWDGVAVPTPTTNAVIAHDVTVATGSGLANNITVQSSKTLTINNGATLDLFGDITNDGTITINHGGALRQTTTGNSGPGIYNVTRTETFQDHTRYSFWSSPVSGETAEDVFFSGNTQTNTNDWIRWDYANGSFNGGQWVDFHNPSSPTTLVPGIGYGFTPTEQDPPTPNNINDTRTFSSQTINNGNIDVTLTGAIGDDYALLGNPYPSNLNISNFLSANDQITAAVYIWSDHADDFNVEGGYYTINSGGITSSPLSQQGLLGPSPLSIAPMQGFFVQLIQAPGDGIVHFTNNQRAAGNSTFLKTDPAEYAWLSLAHESGTGNQVVVGFKDQAVAGYAQGEDSPCLKMSATMEFYVTDPAKDLTIEYRPKPAQSVDYVPLGLDAWATGTYTFALDSTRNWDAAVPVMLLDSMLGQMVDLHQTDYTFNVNFAGSIRDRFYLVLDGATVGEEELPSEADSWYWYQAGDQLHIEGAAAEHITLRNTHGQTVAEVSHQTNLVIEGLARGIYILEVATAGTTTAKKVVLK